MKNSSSPEDRRREFLCLGLKVTSGILMPLAFNGCDWGGSNPISNTKPHQTFVQPNIVKAKNGLLDIQLTVSYFDTKLSRLNPEQSSPVSLRAYGYGSNGPNFFGPTLVVKGGDQLRIKLINQLPFNPAALPSDPLLYMKPNTTNLHTHGLHVFPGVYEESKLTEYGDYVVDSNTGGVVPQGGSRQYVYNIPNNHPDGPFYYHPQFHGSSAIQNASLMQGAIMVRGPIDELPEMAQATELIFLFQAPYFANNESIENQGVKNGSLEKFGQIANYPTGHGVNRSSKGYLDAQPVLINGVRQPTMVMESGEVQRWRFINTQIFNSLNLNLDDHTLYQYTFDGFATADYKHFLDARQKGGDGILLAAGNRTSVIVKAGAPGVYLLRSLPIKIAQGDSIGILPGDVLAKIIVLEEKKEKSIAQNIPATPLPVSDFLKPITDEEFASSGGRKRIIVMNMQGEDPLKKSLELQSPLGKTSAIAQSVISGAEKSIEKNIARVKLKLAQAFGSGVADSVNLALNSVPKTDYQLQASNTVIQNVLLGAVEEWTVYNFNSISRPFHIHVNPMFVTKMNGLSIDPYWCDTVALPSGGTLEIPTSVTFRMRFNDFTGPFILHSQMLQDSDLGMVQRVTVLPT
jgi:FtsP/CotA-like multicopper oxidase with cupredoxin domain